MVGDKPILVREDNPEIEIEVTVSWETLSGLQCKSALGELFTKQLGNIFRDCLGNNWVLAEEVQDA